MWGEMLRFTQDDGFRVCVKISEGTGYKGGMMSRFPYLILYWRKLAKGLPCLNPPEQSG